MVNHISVELDYVTASAGEVQLGYEYSEMTNNGVRTWRWIQMTGGAGAIGQVVERSAGSSTAVGVLGGATTTKASALGVLQHAIPQNSYGFVLCKGVGTVLADGSVTADADIVPDASGEVTDFTAGAEHRVIGVALATDTGASTTVLADLDCR